MCSNLDLDPPCNSVFHNDSFFRNAALLIQEELTMLELAFDLGIGTGIEFKYFIFL